MQMDIPSIPRPRMNWQRQLRPLRKRQDLLAYVSLPRIMPVDGISPISHGTSVLLYVHRMMTELLLLIWIPMKQSQQWNM